VRSNISLHFGSYVSNSQSYRQENFITDVPWDKEGPVKFGKSSGSQVLIQIPDPYQIHPGKGLHSPSACFLLYLIIFLISKQKISQAVE